MMVVLGAGGPAGVNFISSVASSATARSRGLEIVGVDADALRLRNIPGCAQRMVMRGFDLDLLDRIRTADLFHAQPDVLVQMLSAHRAMFRTALPGPKTIAACMDKLRSAQIWAKAGLIAVPPAVLAFRADLAQAEDLIGYPMWIRARRGSGARHATWADTRDVAGSWINYLNHRFGAEDLIAQPYLPGRDFAVTLLYWHGELIAAFARERIQYLYPHLAVSGRTGTPVVSLVTTSLAVESVARAAVEAIACDSEEEKHGVFCVDMREDKDSVLRPTEVNAGRFFTSSHMSRLVGLNVPALYVDAYFSGAVPLETRRVSPELDGTILMRHMDCAPVAIDPWNQTRAEKEAVAASREVTNSPPAMLRPF